MKRLTTTLAGCLAFVALHAQPASESAPDPAAVRKQLRNREIGLRYGVQVGVGAGAPGQAMQYAAVDFAAYNYRNIGLRTGLNLFTTPLHDGQYASIPLQFSWRSGVRRMPTSSSNPRGAKLHRQSMQAKTPPCGATAKALKPCAASPKSPRPCPASRPR